MKKSNVFLDDALAEIPRLLGQQNRNFASLSYGSFDRAYWHYRTNDISSARYQEATLSLALLYANQFEGNVYYQDSHVLDWINAALDFTLSIQNKGGSFNEWYPNEGSFVCTSFVAAATSETLLILGQTHIKNYVNLVAMLDRAGKWIINHEEKIVLNQLSGSIVALYRIFLLTNDISFKEVAEIRALELIGCQSEEGWWNEYGGPDVGYLSLTVDYLAKYYAYTKNEKVLSAIKKATAFIVHFLHPNLTTGGEYMARNTEYLIPSGFASMASDDTQAEVAAYFAIAALKNRSGVQPFNFDDRYLCYILYNWIEAGLAFENTNDGFKIDNFLASRSFDIWFPEAGIRVFQNRNFYFVMNAYKGGAFRIYRDKECYLDSGIETYHQGKYLISDVVDRNNHIDTKQGELTVEGALKPIREPLMKTHLFIVFRLFQITIGRIGGLQRLVKRILREKMITYGRVGQNSYKRSFLFTPDSIVVTDSMGGIYSRGHIRVGTKSSYNFIPSAKYFTYQELGTLHLKDNSEYRVVGDTTTIKRVIYSK